MSILNNITDWTQLFQEKNIIKANGDYNWIVISLHESRLQHTYQPGEGRPPQLRDLQ